ncbi:MAG: hypothetical protein ACK50P_05945, partial [Planctomycetaceae bacterium]
NESKGAFRWPGQRDQGGRVSAVFSDPGSIGEVGWCCAQESMHADSCVIRSDHVSMTVRGAFNV